MNLEANEEGPDGYPAPPFVFSLERPRLVLASWRAAAAAASAGATAAWAPVTAAAASAASA